LFSLGWVNHRMERDVEQKRVGRMTKRIRYV